jgi:hypothetical protein
VREGSEKLLSSLNTGSLPEMLSERYQLKEPAPSEAGSFSW